MGLIFIPLQITCLLMLTIHATASSVTCGDISSLLQTTLEDGNSNYSFRLSHPDFNASEDLVPGQKYTVILQSLEEAPGSITAFLLTADEGAVYFSHTTTQQCGGNGSLEFQWEVPFSISSCFNIRVSIALGTGGETFVINKTICKPPGCRRYYTGISGTVTSPGYPNNYMDDFLCTYVIYARKQQHLYIQLTTLVLEEPYKDRCVDSLSISDGERHLETLCGHKTVDQVVYLKYAISSGRCELLFQTDSKTNYRGFVVYYYTTPTSECSGVYHSLHGNITSPAPTDSPTTCEYIIKLPEHFHILIHVNHLNLPPFSQHPCDSDYVEITSSGVTSREQWCGKVDNSSLESLTYMSVSSDVRISFRTSNLSNIVGFSLTYEGIAACRNETLTGTNGTFASTNFNSNYLNGQQCISRLERSTVTLIELVFEVFYTESYGDLGFLGDLCTLDYVEIHAGSDIHKICGNWQGKEHLLFFRFFTDQLVFKFISNEQITRKGYLVRWSISPSSGFQKTDSCPGTGLSLQSYCYEIVPDQMSWESSKQDCSSRGATLASVQDIHVQTALDRELKQRKLDNHSFWIGANDRLFEGDFVWEDRRAVQFQYWFPGWVQYIESTSQPSDDGLSEEDCVELRRQFDFPGKGAGFTDNFYWNDRRCDADNSYICQYKRNADIYLTAPRECNSVHLLSDNRSSVVVESPGYPDLYPVLIACDVLVTAPFGRNIVVEFSHFTLEEHERCQYDNLTLSSSPGTIGRVICGDWSSRLKKLRWVSTTNTLLLRFQSDYSRNRSGYQATVTYTVFRDDCNDNDSSEDWILGPEGCYLPSAQPATFSQAEKFCSTKGATLPVNLSSEVTYFFRTWLGSSVAGSELCKSWSVSQSLHPRTHLDGPPVLAYIHCDAIISFICMKPIQGITTRKKEYHLTNKEGSITSPGLPNGYPNNTVIHYIFSSPPTHRILFHIRQLDIEYQQNCLYDSIETFSMEGNQILCRMPTTSPYLLSNGENSTIVFTSDESVNGIGFNITWSWIDVSSVIFLDSTSNTTGTLSSFNFLRPFPGRINGCHTIRAPQGHRVLLEMSLIKLPVSSCEANNLTINTSSKTCSRIFCGSGSSLLNMVSLLTGFVASKNEEMLVCLNAPFLEAGQGILARYAFVPSDNAVVSRLFYLIPGKNLTVSQEELLGKFTHVISVRTLLGFKLILLLENIDSLIHENCTEESIIVVDDSLGDRKQKDGFKCSHQNRTVKGMIAISSYLNSLEMTIESTCCTNGSSPTGFRATFMTNEDPLYLSKTKGESGTINHCNSTTCLNGGECVRASLQRFRCVCLVEFTGLFCQVTKCDLHPCKNGVCNVNGSDSAGFQCLCSEGYWGTLCDMDSAHCRYKLCSGHGTCRKTLSQTMCHCTQGRTGVSCEKSLTSSNDSLSIGQKLLREPIWIGMIVILSLVIFFCIFYFTRRKCGDRIANILPKCYKQSQAAKEDEKEDSQPANIYSLHNESSPWEDASGINKTGSQRLLFERIENDMEPASPNSVVSEKNQHAAQRFFQAYNSSRGLLSHSSHFGERDVNLLPRAINEIVPCGLVGGTVSFSEGTLNIKNTEGPLGVISPSPNKPAYKFMKTPSADSRYLNIPKSTPLQRHNSFSGLTSTERNDSTVSVKPLFSRESGSASPEPCHYYPEIRIVNVADTEEKNSESDRDSYQVTNSTQVGHTSERCFQVSTKNTDSGFASTTVSTNNTNSDASNDHGRSIDNRTSAVEKRKLFRSKTKSASFYNINESSNEWNISTNECEMGAIRKNHCRHRYQLPKYESDLSCDTCRHETERNCLYQRDAYSYDEELNRNDHYSFNNVPRSYSHSHHHRRRRHHKRCRWYRQHENVVKRDYFVRGMKPFECSSSTSRSRGLVLPSLHAHKLDMEYCYKQGGVKRSSSTESDQVNSVKIKRKLYRRKSKRHISEGYLAPQAKERIEQWATSSSLEMARNRSDSLTTSPHGDFASYDTTRMCEFQHDQERQLQTPESFAINDLDQSRSSRFNPRSTPADASDCSGQSLVSLSRRLTHTSSVQATNERKSPPTSSDDKPVIQGSFQSVVEKSKDSAYQTKQSSLDIVCAYSRDRSMSVESSATGLTKFTDGTSSLEDRVSKHLHQAAIKLALMKGRRARDRYSNDSAVHTFSEEDPSGEGNREPRSAPLVKRLSGSLALQLKESGLSDIKEEMVMSRSVDWGDVLGEDQLNTAENATTSAKILTQESRNTINPDEIEMVEISV